MVGFCRNWDQPTLCTFWSEMSKRWVPCPGFTEFMKYLNCTICFELRLLVPRRYQGRTAAAHHRKYVHDLLKTRYKCPVHWRKSALLHCICRKKTSKSKKIWGMTEEKMHYPMTCVSGESSSRLPDHADRYWTGPGVPDGWSVPLQVHKEEFQDSV